MPQIVEPKPKAPTPAPKAEPAADELIYPEFEVKVCVGESDVDDTFRRSLTCEKAKTLVGWLEEADYTAQQVAANPKVKESAAKFSYRSASGETKLAPWLVEKGLDVLFTSVTGQRVVCLNNAHNRPFSEPWAKRFCQEVLTKNWRLNGETIIVGQRGNVLSGQKRLVGFIEACNVWAANRERFKDVWPDEPTLDCVVVFGVEETPETIRTLDNVQPRTEADTIFTDETYANLSPAGKKECSRMLARATDFLWQRTGECDRLFVGNQKLIATPSELAAFRERHPFLLKAVKHLFEENQDRAISDLKLSPGMCAGILYLQACADSDAEAYRAGSPPEEKGLSWKLRDRAKEFWTELAKADGADPANPKRTVPGSPTWKAVAGALALLVDPDDGTAGRLSEKLVVLAKAWELFAAGKPFKSSDLTVDYVERDAQTTLDPEQTMSFGGIDRGPGRQEEAEPEVPEQTVAERKAELAQQALKAVEETPAQERARREAVLKAAEEKKAKLLANRQARAADGKPNGQAPAKKPALKIKGVARKQ